MVVKISGEKNIPKLIFSSLFIYTGSASLGHLCDSTAFLFSYRPSVSLTYSRKASVIVPIRNLGNQ